MLFDTTPAINPAPVQRNAKSIWREPVVVVGAGLVGLYLVGPAISKALFPKKVTKQRQQNPLTIYGADWCPACVQLKARLDDSGVPHVFRNIDEDESANAFVQATSEEGSIPVIQHRGKVHVGYNEYLLRQLGA